MGSNDFGTVYPKAEGIARGLAEPEWAESGIQMISKKCSSPIGENLLSCPPKPVLWIMTIIQHREFFLLLMPIEAE